MLKHYLMSALRHFRRHRFTAAINVACLTIGLICFLAVHLVVSYLHSSDRSLPSSDRIYALTERISLPGSDVSLPMSPYTGGGVARYLRQDFPQLPAVARAVTGSEASVAVGAQKSFVHTAYADPEFFDILALPFVAGDARNALRQPFSAVLTQDLATRLFGNSLSAIGGRVRLQDGTDVTVTGVLAPISQPSHMGSADTAALQFEILLSMNVLDRGPTSEWLARWNTPMGFTYLRLPATGLTSEDLVRQLGSFGARRAPPEICKCEFSAIPLRNMNLSLLNRFIGTDKTGISSGTLLYTLGLIVLVVSCLNYANLATAQSLTRATEIGIRRVMGAARGQIIWQYMTEAALLTLLSFFGVVIVIAIIALLAPQLAEVLSVVWRQGSFWLATAVLVAGASLISGAYPAFVLSRIRPVRTVAGGRARLGFKWVTTLMVVAQFVAASFLLIAILVVSAQNRGLRQAALQSGQDPIILISSSLGAANLKFDSLQRELLRQPHIKAASAALVPPWRLNCFQEMIVANPSSGAARWAACSNLVNYDLFETLGIKLLAGRAFDRQHADDVTLVPPDLKRMPAVVIDQVLATQYGWTDPQQAIGKIIYWGNWSNSSAPPFRFRVIGVTQPTVLTLVGTGATANFFALTPDMASLPIVRLSKTDVPAALKEVESVWNEFAPGVALKWRFADDLQNEAYRLFRLIGAACTGIALLALAVAVLGMIGMSVHVIGRRTHEIGVRKTIGASAGRVVAMLLQDFSRPVVIANLVAWPLAFIAMRYYLSVFTYRIDLSLAPFVASFALTVLIACLAVIVQAARAARLSPAIVLRHQ